MNIDYDVGDMVVALKDSHEFPIKAGAIFLCIAIPKCATLPCNVCGDCDHGVRLAGVAPRPDCTMCPCNFRKWYDHSKEVEMQMWEKRPKEADPHGVSDAWMNVLLSELRKIGAI